MKYWIFHIANDGAVIADYPRSKIKNWRYSEGERLAKEFPKKATVQFADRFKNKRKLYDCVCSLTSALIVSGKVRGILEELDSKDLEFLAVSIKDHQGKVVSDDYFILNPVGTQDVIDMKKSKLVMSPLMEGEISDIKKLALQPKAVTPGANLFRAKGMRRLILIDDTARKAFEKNCVTGYHLCKAQGWDGLPIWDAEDADGDV